MILCIRLGLVRRPNHTWGTPFPKAEILTGWRGHGLVAGGTCAGCPGLQLVSAGMPRKPAEEQAMAGLLCAPGSSVINRTQCKLGPREAPSFATLQYLSKSCLTLYDPMDCSPPDSSVHGIFQARILEWVPISFSRKVTYLLFIKAKLSVTQVTTIRTDTITLLSLYKQH